MTKKIDRIALLEIIIRQLQTDIQILSDAFIRLESFSYRLKDDVQELDIGKERKKALIDLENEKKSKKKT